ncbi:Pigment-dispersing hormone (PDH) [Nesidiocoris tenuis]|uniref:Pigment-dispersing hormone (PDH) n=1 Tax=Nesidiocoris tenuis TaxID=355587 RepID=A0ABN7ABK6_9HEMI|nr:Pigment-dispersing hormone (PDH) [Nesidiocoris tenuis]
MIALTLASFVCIHAMKTSAFVLNDESLLELQAVDPSAVKEIAYVLLDVAKGSQKAHKRNSELINSLLGLPKVLNDAGR